VHFEQTELFTARWVSCDDAQMLKKFVDGNKASLGNDHDGDLVFLARNSWHLNKAQEDYPKVVFSKIKEQAL
jgi:peptide chain release factor 3